MTWRNSQAIRKTIDTASLDPDLAATLLRENNPANRAALGRATHGWQGHEASTLVDMLTPPDDATNSEGKTAIICGAC
jgi:hypothetical protein